MPKFNLGGIFKKKEPSSCRETRSSSSNTPMRPSYNENLEPLGVIVLARESDVRSSVYPCYEFLQAAGIRDEFTSLGTNACLTNIVLVERPQYLKLTNIFVQSFNFIDDQYHPSVEFMLYEQPWRMPLSEFLQCFGCDEHGAHRQDERAAPVPQGALCRNLS